MAEITADRVYETSTTTGAGAYTLAGAIAGFRAFSAVCANGDVVRCFVEDVDGSGVPNGGWEVGVYTWGAGNTLARTSIEASSNGGAAVNWAPGARRIGLTATAGRLQLLDPTFVPGNMSKWTVAKARGASSPARLAFCGDSNVAGQGTGAGTNGLTGAASTCMARKLATLAGFQVESFFGEQNVLGAGGTVVGYDSRITLGSGWAGDTAPNVFGGRFMKSTAAPAGRLTFSPAAAFSKFRIWHPISSVGNTATTVYVDGSLVDTFSEAGSNAFTSKDYTVSAGTHVIGVGGGATGNVFVAGIETFDGSSAPVMLAGGWSGAKVADINGTSDPWSYRNSLAAMAPDFTIVYCTINDANSKTAGNTYYAALEAFVKAISLTSGGCLCLGFPASAAATNDSYYDALAASLRNLAADYGWFFYDSRRVFGRSFARATDKGYAYDNLHPNATGSDAMATDLYGLLRAAGF
ncbi:hypothetical protein APR50_23095 [Variovorax paradoxus]|jgi:hypothetical protein|uniref:SGNH/GDSL hydrolase family protein n=1 Tax=Variovorax paradoxus TaxID=34073 RepID=UPI0006E5D52E|nr:hypothetical protein APR52_14215 [Variovorax paradoxus]KPV04046.1 hypothetical protein APR50_23095 [Variovorax paradoxus]KPV08117.1 hypothetical protein APR49_16285 [Variovorax paradoxus]KPV22581.1 hypothetical protein APR51_10280 [Variovorax paradoxus]KPV35349.1 hypothetical protein APR48_04170 [Variovorax paradoxus]